jgi:hypothetical protein
MKLTIVHTSGTRAGTQRSISSKAVVKLGRHPDNDLVFDAPDDVSVSAHHAEIRIEQGRAIIADLYSTNGTFVNGQQVSEHPLSPNDVVQFGPQGSGFRVEYAAPTMQPAPGSPAAAAAAPVAAAAAAPAPTTDVMPSPPGAEPAAPPEPPPPEKPAELPRQEQPPAGEQDGQKKYGQRTVGVMIQQALEQAGAGKKQGTSKSTEYFEALVDKQVKTKTSKLKVIIVISIIGVVVAGGVFAIIMWLNRDVQVTQQINYGDAAGSSIASQNRYTVFMLAGAPKSNPRGDLMGFCTGFAIAPDLLATNAHCVRAAKAKFSTVWALMNGVRKSRYQVTAMVPHPGYTPDSISPDVALMRVNTRLEHLVTMADANELTQVAPGAPMFLYGFPGRLNKEEAPEATFIKGDIGRVTTFDQELGDFGHNTLLQHSAYSTGGTSGSPMFNSSGHVIGVNAGGYVEAGEVLHGYNFGMRIDLVHTLYPMIGAQR